MRFYYLTTRAIYPHDKHLIEGWRELGHEVVELHEPAAKGAVMRMAKKVRGVLKANAIDSEHAKNNEHEGKIRSDIMIIVGFTCPLFVFSAWLGRLGKGGTTGRRIKIIFNATSSQYEANIVSRGTDGIFSLQAIRWWLIDFLSFHLSNAVLLESNEQIEYLHKLFAVRRKKLVRSFSGLDEKEFYYDPAVQKRPEFTVLFRGRFLPESGILTVIEAAKKLEGKSGEKSAGDSVAFRIIGHGFLYREVNALMDKLKPSNIEMITERIPIDDLRRKMLECHVSLGQLADHPRLDRTLPCKLFESLALKLPYLTGRNKAAMEILEDGGTCIMSAPGDADDLALKILELKRDPDRAARIGSAGYALYKERLTSKKLAEEMLADMTDLFSKK